ncbi:MAG: Holliday junction branch migration protein RuvA [Oscillospiraceae bacterium]|nr:Holliday junction branch migration protein RuvA [Oscillospiraceae bacterium]
MFYYLNGTVAELLPGMAVMDCGGVGYACRTTSNTLSALKRGQNAKLYTFLHVGDAIFDLYGFATRNELDAFRMLIGVSGVGPKAALGILSTVTPDALTLAIVTEDERALTSAPGIGKKIARRMILELKDRLSGETFGGGADVSGGGAVPVFVDKATEAAQALTALGYSAQEIRTAMKGLDTASLPLEEIIRQSLKKMAK